MADQQVKRGPRKPKGLNGRSKVANDERSSRDRLHLRSRHRKI
jgi:hypothetical protein